MGRQGLVAAPFFRPVNFENRRRTSTHRARSPSCMRMKVS